MVYWDGFRLVATLKLFFAKGQLGRYAFADIKCLQTSQKIQSQNIFRDYITLPIKIFPSWKISYFLVSKSLQRLAINSSQNTLLGRVTTLILNFLFLSLTTSFRIVFRDKKQLVLDEPLGTKSCIIIDGTNRDNKLSHPR